jgi:hypothetical protein
LRYLVSVNVERRAGAFGYLALDIRRDAPRLVACSRYGA